MPQEYAFLKVIKALGDSREVWQGRWRDAHAAQERLATLKRLRTLNGRDRKYRDPVGVPPDQLPVLALPIQSRDTAEPERAEVVVEAPPPPALLEQAVDAAQDASTREARSTRVAVAEDGEPEELATSGEQAVPLPGRAEEPDLVQPESGLAPTTPAAGSPDRRRWIVLGLGGLGVMAVIALVALLVAALGDDTSSTPPHTWSGTIGNTANAQGVPIGTYGYAGPDTNLRSGPGYPEGTKVTVECHRPGREVRDRTMNTESNIWYKLVDGNWISKLYFVADPAANRPQDSIPVCE